MGASAGAGPHTATRPAAPAAAATGTAGWTAVAGAATVAGAPRQAPAAFTKPPCTLARPGHQRCFLAYRPQAAVNRVLAAGRSATPQGWGAPALRRAYRLPSRPDSHQTVAVSIAFHTPALARYLAIYRKRFGLPPCTAASGCLIAGVYGLAGNGASTTPRRLYRQPGSFFDVRRGDNALGIPAAKACGDYLCTAQKGYDAPTGLGSPDGIGAF